MWKMLCQQKLVPKMIGKENSHIISNGDHCRKIGSPNLFVASPYYIAEFKMMKLVEEVKCLSQFKRNLAI